MKYFKIISSFLSKLFSEKRFVNSVQFNLVFPPSIKSINPIQKYQHIESYACILKIFVFIFMIHKCSNLVWNMFSSERIKISSIVILYVQNNPMSSNVRVLIKIYYIYPILFFFVNYLSNKHH